MKYTFDNFIVEPMNLNKPQFFYNLIEKNRPRLEDYFAGTVAKTRILEDTTDYLNSMKEKVRKLEYLPFVILDTTNNKLVGFMDLKNVDMNVPKGELGCFIDEDYERKGIPSKAVSIFIDHLVRIYHFKKLLCRVSATNKPSIRVIEKNKFELEGTIRKDYKTTDGTVVDMLYYGRLF